jgi:hypothetical protein
MMKTALLILQEVRRGMNLDVPSTLLSLTDPDELQMLQFLYDVSEELRRKGPFRQQVQRHEFATVSGKSTYPLPVDFYENIPLTQYNRDTKWRLIGPLTDYEFAAFKDGELYIPAEYAWRIAGFDENPNSVSGRQLEVYPTPAAVENLSFDYISGNLFVPPNWAPTTGYTSGQYVNVNGRIYLCDTNGTSGATPPSGTSSNQTDGSTRWDSLTAPYATINSDSDTCIFDADIVKLGVRSKYYLEKGGDLGARVDAEFQSEIKKMRFRWSGQTRVRGDGTTTKRGPFVSPGSWSFV